MFFYLRSTGVKRVPMQFRVSGERQKTCLVMGKGLRIVHIYVIMVGNSRR